MLQDEQTLRRTVAKNIAAYRKSHKDTQLDLARKLNYSDKSVSKWERGEGLPDVYILAQIAQLYGVTVSNLIGEEEPPKKANPHFHIYVLLLSVALVYAIARRTKGNRVTSLLLAGVMIGSLFSACTSYVKLVADPSNQLPAITYWLMGSLSGTRMNVVAFAAVPMLIGLAPLLILRWRINLLTLGEEEARSMGANTNRLRLVVILCATVLTAASVAVSGMIGWVGLVIPHLSRKLVGNDCRHLLPASALFGAIFLLLVDNISRNLLATEIPIGILTAFVGAPFFLYLMTRKEHLL